MKGNLLIVVVLAGCVGELETETRTQAATRKASVVACYELDARNALCELDGIRFESKDLGLSNCTKTRAGHSCDALRVDSPNLPPELWEGYIPPSNGGVWKTSNRTCADAALVCDAERIMHCWCDSGTAKGGKVEFEWKVEEGES